MLRSRVVPLEDIIEDLLPTAPAANHQFDQY